MLSSVFNMDLEQVFDEINQEHFEGFLDTPGIMWNRRLSSSAGRFIPGSQRYDRPPIIEVAHYLLKEPNAVELIRDTMAHEMIHFWLWSRGKPYGHTPEFYQKMRQMGVSRYNPVPRLRPFRYIYRCPACEKDFPTKRRLGPLACLNCCQRHSEGRYDARFKLVVHKRLSANEGLELAKQRTFR